MAELGISIAEKLIEVFGSPLIQEICDAWNYKSQLEGLKNTVITVKRVLLDAETKQDRTNEEVGYVEQLKDALYEADDLFDEFLTLVELKQLRPDTRHGKFFAKVSSFFSSNNHVSVAYRMSRQVKEIRKRLDSIAADHNKFGFSVDYKPIRSLRGRDETCSYVDAKKIIGRDDDMKAIIDMLLESHSNVRDVQFLTIVGVGGLGKTTLAQLVFNNEKVKNEFPELRVWVSVSDQGVETFDVKKILCKILEVVCHKKIDGDSTLELVQKQFSDRFLGKKYLFVLDDVWNEDRSKWDSLQEFLALGQEGSSRVIVTTRSKMTATIVGGTYIHNLGGLSPESSWQLFEVTAFKIGEKVDNELIKIGEMIVKKCYNNPLAIKVVGSLLFGQDIHKWRSFEKSGLTGIGNGDNDIMSILKLSYHNLDPSMKSCFIYCALFPKDTPLNRDMMISRWMAQGYIVPFDEGQSIEDAAKEYFLILLRRCFFEDLKKRYGEVEWVKLHDLMHDVAQEVAKEEICMASSRRGLGGRIRHVCNIVNMNSENSSNSKIRTFIDMRHNMPVSIKNLDSHKCLRVLDLRNVKFGDISLLHTIGKLLHLRYLNLSNKEDLVVLPDSITELHNLQTLILCNCSELRELPRHFSKLIKLRHLDLRWCGLRGMPVGMDKLTHLRVLPIFVVGENTTILTQRRCNFGKLEDLLALTNVEGEIHITISSKCVGVEGATNREERSLKALKNLSAIEIRFDGWRVDSEEVDSEVAVMDKLEPHSFIKRFSLMNYHGKTIPRWGREENNWAISLSHLVEIKLADCTALEQMPLLSKLPHLKSLNLYRLHKLEYMESASSDSINSQYSELVTFFPNLEYLELSLLISLKAWWKGEGEGSVDDGDDSDRHNIMRKKNGFPRLSKLKVTGCSKLTSFPPCPSLEEVTLSGINENLRILENMKDKEEDEVRLRIVDILDGNVGCLKSLRSPCLTALAVSFKHVGNTSEIEGVFQSHASSLQKLVIYDWFFTRRHSMLSGLGLEHLINLNFLEFIFEEPYYTGVERKEDDDDDDDAEGMPWKSLNQSLRTLRFHDHKDIRRLPRGIQYLSSLQTLQLWGCSNLNVLPDWISSLSSLRSLSISKCISIKSLPGSIENLFLLRRLEIYECDPILGERCKQPNGEDWPKIQHIPHIEIRPLPKGYSSKQLMLGGSRVSTWS